MIDYLEELLEEETAVSLTERPLGGWEEFPQEETETAVPPDQQKPWGPALPPEPEAPAEPGREGTTLPYGERRGQSFPWEAQMTRSRNTLRWQDSAGARRAGGENLAQALRRAQRTARAAAQERRALRVLLPEGNEAPRPMMDVQELDRAVQRDARRYDGGFPLY